MREQARKQIEWRLARRTNGNSPLQRSPSFLRASIFDQNDLYSAAGEFEDEVNAFMRWMAEKGSQFGPATQEAGFGNTHSAEWEEIATWWGKGQAPSAAVLGFFDNYVHDSRAWFKLIPGNPDNEKDMLELLESWVKRRKAVTNHNEMRSKMRGRGNAIYQIRARTGLLWTSDVRLEYEKTGKIPRLVTEGREPWGSASDLLRCAGYLRFRKIYGGFDFELLS